MLLDLIMNPKATGKVVNVCSGVGTSMRDVVQVLIKLLDPPVTLVEKPIENSLEDVYVGSVDRLRHLGLNPSVCNLSFCIQNMLES
jgi:GDP-4-dehydro-6-deoxy-D-mannose reductase